MTESFIEYIVNGFWNEIGDPRVAHLPLFKGGPLPVLFIITLYLGSIKVCNFFMKHRDAMNLRLFMVAYNILLVAVNGIGFIFAFYLTTFGVNSWFCYPVKHDDDTIRSKALIYLGYSYFITKLVDLIDTIIFCLRKKGNQITVLHCFHHSVMPLTAWAATKIHPGGMSAFTPLINSLVHTAMHTYYGLSALGSVALPFLWWKKYLTMLQMVQFTLTFIHAFHTFFVPNCSWPLFFAFLEGTESLLFFLMFSNFYIKSYNLKRD